MLAAEDALGRPCVADACFLNNFVHSGNFRLLNRTVGRPIYLTPAVLDAEEAISARSKEGLLSEPTSEFLKPLYMSTLPGYGGYKKKVSFAYSFAGTSGEMWEPADPTFEELKLATRLCGKDVGEEVRRERPEMQRTRIELGKTGAEAAAVAISRGWTLLSDDLASTTLLGCLFPGTPTIQTCQLLIQAVNRNLIPCAEAARIFNERVVDGLGLRAAYRKSGEERERLWIRCTPLGCVWERVPS